MATAGGGSTGRRRTRRGEPEARYRSTVLSIYAHPPDQSTRLRPREAPRIITRQGQTSPAVADGSQRAGSYTCRTPTRSIAIAKSRSDRQATHGDLNAHLLAPNITQLESALGHTKRESDLR